MIKVDEHNKTIVVHDCRRQLHLWRPLTEQEIGNKSFDANWIGGFQQRWFPLWKRYTYLKGT